MTVEQLPPAAPAPEPVLLSPGANRIDLVAGCDWLAGVPRGLVDTLVAASVWRELATGEVLAHSGDLPDTLFILVAGRVGAWRGADGTAPGTPGGHGIWYWVSDEVPVSMGLENLVAGSRWYASLCAQAHGTVVLAVPAFAEPGRRPVDVLLVAVGATVPDVLVAAGAVEQAGFTVRVVDPCWVNPVPAALADIARASSLVVTVEDGVVVGGVGSRIAQFLRAQNIDVPTREIGIPVQFLDHAKVDQVKALVGLTAQDIGRRVVEWAATVRDSDRAGAGADLHDTDHS